VKRDDDDDDDTATPSPNNSLIRLIVVIIVIRRGLAASLVLLKNIIDVCVTLFFSLSLVLSCSLACVLSEENENSRAGE
jgi:hypothetical protein